MPLDIPASAPTLLIRRQAYERAGLVRSQLDERYGLVADEFRTEGEIIAIGPLYGENAVGDLIEQLEALGLVYFEDFFELSGNWPEWCRIYVRGAG